MQASKPPPLLLGAALLFWGWQTHFLAAGALMALVVEGARLLRTRWEFAEEDFARIWLFCFLVFLGAAVYAFTSNEGPTEFRGFFQNPNFFTQKAAGASTARTAAALFRWLPMIFFLFVAAQQYSSQESMPLRTLSLIARPRWKKARALGQPSPAGRTINVSYPYFGLCLFAAAIHVSESSNFFWGLSVLLAWGLWPLRSRRFGLAAWAVAFGLAVLFGYAGQRGIGQLQSYLSNINPQWLTSFGRRRFEATQSRTELGSLGRLKMSSSIVIRLETSGTPPPPLLREASYVSFKGKVWSADIREADFEDVKWATNETTFVLAQDNPPTASVNIACYLAGGKALLPLPTGTARLDNLMAYFLRKSRLGAVMDQGPGLVMFDAFYGPGPTIDSGPDPAEDLSVPPKEEAALDQIIDELHLKEQSPAQRIRTLSSFFTRKFSYSTWQEPPPLRNTNDTPLSRFLLHTHKGHCEYFATAGVLLLRRAGVPARYAVGYAIHEGSGGKYVVRQRDAHAWCLVWDEATHIWRDLDLTPSSWVQAESHQASVFQFLSDFWSRLRFEFSKFRWGQGHLRQYLLLALVPVLAVLLYQILFRARRQRRNRAQRGRGDESIWPGLDSEFFQLERELVGRGLPRQHSEPLWSWLKRALSEPSLLEVRDQLQELLLLHYRYRFDPRGLTSEERADLRHQVTALLAQLRGSVRFAEPA